MTSPMADLRYALRGLRRSPGFAAIAIASLALGIGANTAIFSVVHGVLLRPLAFPSPDRLVALEERDKEGNGSNTSYATYVDWRARSRFFADTAAVSYWNPKLSGEGGAEPEKIEGLRVSDGFFRVLGIRPAIGRDFLPAEDLKSAPRVAILSHGLWKRRFGSDPALVGRTVRISDIPFTVVGVLPAGFESVFSMNQYASAEVWSPLRYDATLPWACRTCRHLRAIGRLKPGVSLPQARAELDVVSRALWREHPRDYASAGVLVTPYSEKLTAAVRPALWILLGAVAFVLLIACANVASLLLAEASSRRREIAIRSALGAGRLRVARLFLAEALILAVAGGTAGVAAAAWILQALLRLAPTQLPRLESVRIDGAVLLFSCALSLITGVLFGLVPALRMSRRDPQTALKDGGGSGRGRSARAAGLLVVFDAAIAFLLVFGAGLFVKSTARLLHVDPGFHAERVVKAEIDLSGPRYNDDAPVVAFYERVLDRVRTIPGVVAAGVVSQLPLGGNQDSYGIHIVERPAANPEDDPSADRYGASPDYLRVMGIPVRRGRGFTAEDRAGSRPVILINETFARLSFPGEDPIGKQIRTGDRPPKTIVGVAGDVRHSTLEAPPGRQIYVPASQWADNSMILVVQTAGDAAALAGALRSAIHSVDPDQPVGHIATLERVVEDSAATRRFSMKLLAGFAILATLLAAVGIFGVVSGSVARRTREIGIRMALGAGRRSILRLVTGRAVGLALVGVAAGTIGALLLGRTLRALLFDVAPTDPAVLAAGAAAVAAVSLLASLLPARRATRVDPLVALREE
ncbi:MAG: ABC transporter permease [Acidobacteriota bacterium]|nr:ABC transporter permease [Acidobacteriota bacterium]